MKLIIESDKMPATPRDWDFEGSLADLESECENDREEHGCARHIIVRIFQSARFAEPVEIWCSVWRVYR